MGIPKFIPLAILAYLTLGSASPLTPSNDPKTIGNDSPKKYRELTVVGDSYAAGGGANGWIQPLRGCMRSESAYANWLGKDKDLGFQKVNHQACAGSGVAEVQKCQIGANTTSYPATDCSKMDMDPKAFGKPDVVISQFGIDKIAFDQVLRACIYRRGEFSCDAALAATDKNLTALEKSGAIETTLKDAAEKTGTNRDALVLALGYPAPFNKDTKNCSFGIYQSNSTEDWHLYKEKHPTLRDDINKIIQRLNGIIQSQAKLANGTDADIPDSLKPAPGAKGPFNAAGSPTGPQRIKYVDIDDAFGGHRWCDFHEEWFTALYTWQQTAIYLNADEPQFYGGLFHPNFAGSRAIFNAIRQTLGSKPLNQADTNKFILAVQNKDPMEAEPWAQDDEYDLPAEPIQPASIPNIKKPDPPPPMTKEQLDKIWAELNSSADLGSDAFSDPDDISNGMVDDMTFDADADADADADDDDDDSGDDLTQPDSTDDPKKPDTSPPPKQDPHPAPKQNPHPAPKQDPHPAPKQGPPPKPLEPPKPAPKPASSTPDPCDKASPDYNAEACLDKSPGR